MAAGDASLSEAVVLRWSAHAQWCLPIIREQNGYCHVENFKVKVHTVDQEYCLSVYGGWRMVYVTVS